jgi:hypothetical protein
MAIKTKSTERTVVTKSFPDFISELESGLRIDENNLNQALIEQPQVFYAVAKELAIQISRRDQAKQRLSEVEAEFDIDFREKARAEDRKVTEGQISSEKQLDGHVIAASKELSQISGIVGQLTALKDAYIQRNYALGHLTDLQLKNYYSTDAGVRRPMNDMRDQRASEGKEAAKQLYRRDK